MTKQIYRMKPIMGPGLEEIFLPKSGTSLIVITTPSTGVCKEVPHHRVSSTLEKLRLIGFNLLIFYKNPQCLHL